MNLTRVVLDAIAAAPLSIGAIAKAAKVSGPLLFQIRRGDFHVTPDVAEKIATALERWGREGKKAIQAARKIRAAARKVPTPRTKGKP